MTCDAHGQVEVITTATGQLVKFDPQFDIEEDRPALVQHHNTSTGRTTTLGALKSHDGPQTYVVPKGVTVSQEDHIIIFNPELDDDVASVELAE